MDSMRGVRRQQPQLLDSQLGFKFVLLVQLYLRTGFVICSSDIQPRIVYDTYELHALQSLWNAWNTSTPDVSSNLAGWSSSQTFPCESDHGSWRGVTCTSVNVTSGYMHSCETITNCGRGRRLLHSNRSYISYDALWPTIQISVIGLSLSNVSIVGTLPDVFLNYYNAEYLSSLSTLELIGNPNLTGPLPSSLASASLYVLDLHDNAFNGNIPNNLLFPHTLQYIDLSGNQISGDYPFEQFKIAKNALQSFSISRNYFSGVIPVDAFREKTKLQKIDISHNIFTGNLPDLSNNTELLYLDVSGNLFEGPLPNLTKFEYLRYVNLSGNNFTGTLTNLSDFVNVTAARVVVFSNINLTGPLLPNLKALDLGSIQELYLDCNNITGILDIAHYFSEHDTYNVSAVNLRVLSLMNSSIVDVAYTSDNIKNQKPVVRLQGSPYCLGQDVNADDAKRCFCTQLCYITPQVTPAAGIIKSERRKIITIAVTASATAVAFIVLVLVGAILLKNRRYRQYLHLQFQQKFEEFDVKPTIYSYNELKAATRDFHEENKLGQGSYGAVYKGVLPNGNVVAVKQLFVKKAQTGLDEFSNEIVLITGMKHRNLVNLKGCCLREDSRILVYEYVNNHDVDQILLGAQRQVVSWPSRRRICLGIAHGLHYLHALAHPRVIHRDIKASNILLDKNLEPKVADFGLALLFPDDESHILTVHVAGTKGYLAPEYATLGQLSDKVDVYSFGVLCLEIISGRRNIDESLPLKQVYLSQWAWKLHESDKLIELVDPTLQLNDEEVEDVQQVINIALLCTQMASEKRPTMARIVSMLQGTVSDVALQLCAGEHLQQYELSKGSQTSGLSTVEELEWSSYGYRSEGQRLRESNVVIDIELM